MTADNQPLRVLIFGAGAIGTYLGCSLHHSGSEVVFVEKGPVAVDLRKRGLHLSLPGQELSIRDPKIVESVEQALELGPFDIGIFALKSFDTGSALQSLVPHKDRLPPILCLQNGVDNESLLAAELGAENVIAGTVTSSILRRSAGDVALERKRGHGCSRNPPNCSPSVRTPGQGRFERQAIRSTARYEVVQIDHEFARKCQLGNSRHAPRAGFCRCGALSPGKITNRGNPGCHAGSKNPGRQPSGYTGQVIGAGHPQIPPMAVQTAHPAQSGCRPRWKNAFFTHGPAEWA